MPSNKIKRILKAICLIIKNFHKAPLKILKSLNVFKYGKTTLSLKLLYTLIPFLDEKDFDIIHCHFGPNGILGVCLKEIGIPGEYITSFHGYDVNCYPKIMGENVYNVLFKKGDLFTANTNFTRQKVIKLGCDKNKIKILPVGLKIERFKFYPRKVQHGESIEILTVGRLVEEKGHEYAIRAIAEVVKKHKNTEYIIAGDGYLRNSLENLSLELGIHKRVNFLGAVDQNEVLQLYHNVKIFILPSIRARNGAEEGQGLVLQEAQSSGPPIISTFVGGIPEGVIDGKSGFLVPEKNIDALAEKLEYLIGHPEIWLEMGECGRKYVEEKYDMKKLNKKLVEIYQNLIESKYE